MAGTRKSNKQGHSFAAVPKAEIQRSSFDRSCGVKTTFNAGYLIPIFVDEALPGDTISLRMSQFARLSTPLYPTMDNMSMETFFFSVPLRLIWDNWQKFNGEQIDPGDSTDFLVPETTAPVGGHLAESISDYFGIPTGVDISHSALWHRASNLIWNEWFRDENLQDSLPVPKDDGPDAITDYQVQRRGKRHDYFTSCLPFAQKGPSVPLPITGTAPVVLDGNYASATSWGDYKPTFEVAGSTNGPFDFTSAGGTNIIVSPTPDASSDYVWDNPMLRTFMGGITGTADLSAATAATINELRQSFQIQRLYERDARGGSRYIEILKSHFGVTSPDARLQRPEYLGGGSTVVNITPVPQTSEPTPDNPLGALGGFGIASTANGSGFNKSFVEHCVVLGFVSVRADLNYQQGLNRMFSRRTRWDFYWPAFAHLGEQAVLNKEIFSDGSAADDNVFGYQERYAEYRYKPSQITGQLRSQYAQSLDAWHLAQDFDTLPVLDSAFIQDNPPVERIVAIPTFPHFIFDGFFNIKHARPMPTYSVPGLIDHF